MITIMSISNTFIDICRYENKKCVNDNNRDLNLRYNPRVYSVCLTLNLREDHDTVNSS